MLLREPPKADSGFRWISLLCAPLPASFFRSSIEEGQAPPTPPIEATCLQHSLQADENPNNERLHSPRI